MGVGDILDQVRDNYINRLTRFGFDLQSTGDEIFIEPAMIDPSGAMILDGPLLLPSRIDAAVVRNGSVIRLAQMPNETELSYDTIRFAWESTLDVTISGFAWSAMRLMFSGPHSLEAFDPLAQWYQKWFRASCDGGEFQGDSVVHAGAVHSLHGPVATSTGNTIVTLDLGSASVGAVEELLDTFRMMRVGHLLIGEG